MMKGYFSVMVSLCVILLTLQSVEMSPAARERRQTDNVVGISREFADTMTKGIMDFMEGLVETFLGSMG
ncbi:hypothetical protein NPIL_387951 [Nephila pilipes]|uniref:Uncharacterized protein n=1 Tax=Nephila pilipes TaxID=299642 RepID=A0A8X6TH69_NEPPI|nr:hypothetical protein NPIL_387951 [Nephila pilipes]